MRSPGEADLRRKGRGRPHPCPGRDQPDPRGGGPAGPRGGPGQGRRSLYLRPRREEAMVWRRRGCLRGRPGGVLGGGRSGLRGDLADPAGYTSTLAFVTGHEDPTKDRATSTGRPWRASGHWFFSWVSGTCRSSSRASSRTGKNGDPGGPDSLGDDAGPVDLAGTLGTIVELARERKFSPPGDLRRRRGGLPAGEALVVREPAPLRRGVVITRPEVQAESFAALLEERGARVVHFPGIRIAEPEDWSGLDEALDNLSAYAWIVFTSANGVRYFFDRLRERGGDVRDLRGIRIATIGPASAAAVEGRGIRVDIVRRSTSRRAWSRRLKRWT